MTTITDTSKRPYDVSIIVPFLNEDENLEQLYGDIKTALETTNKTFEIVFVDDGSSDGSVALLQSLATSDDRIKVVEFTRNFGQTAAMAAGFKYAQGRIYVAIDADNQNDPADIPKLLEMLDQGNDVVSGWRKNRQDKLFTRKIPSKIANKLLSSVTGVKLKDYGCSLKAYRAEYLDSVSLYGEMHRFIPAYASMAGAKVVEIPVNHRARTKGQSKYGLTRVFKVLMDLITVKFLSSYMSKPSYLFGGIGSILCSLGMISACEVLIEKFVVGTFAHKNPFLLLAVFLFFLGVQLILMGLIAEIQVRTYHESQGKEVYLVKKTVNL
ncbi:MAG: glycosyltransferase family 2 protein [Deltaproteobacteria bacterium]|jgi:glycosyltransferase involved in cell wall biosynthesis|nr:glycosyltransferase family 2 protein [Deltaproteobacteria bacterium]